MIVFHLNPTNLRSQRAVVKIGAVPDPGLDTDGRMIFRLTRHAAAPMPVPSE